MTASVLRMCASSYYSGPLMHSALMWHPQYSGVRRYSGGLLRKVSALLRKVSTLLRRVSAPLRKVSALQRRASAPLRKVSTAEELRTTELRVYHHSLTYNVIRVDITLGRYLAMNNGYYPSVLAKERALTNVLPSFISGISKAKPKSQTQSDQSHRLCR